jgi:hypothetical protein
MDETLIMRSEVSFAGVVLSELRRPVRALSRLTPVMYFLWRPS